MNRSLARERIAFCIGSMPCRHEQNSHEDPDLQPDFVSKGVGDHGPSPTQRYKIQRLLHGLETITRLHDLPIAGRRLVGAGDDRQIAARFAIDLIEGHQGFPEAATRL